MRGHLQWLHAPKRRCILTIITGEWFIVKQSVDADFGDSAPHRSLSRGRAVLLVAAGGLLQTIGETLSLGTSGALSAGSALLIFSSTALAVALF
jgi:hypothetical protein